eukprot:m.121260 g.121260  ORF g.121260 m.121260 type:complete len:182 (+) comp12920_c6_seq10:45-590(+)
MSGKRKKSDGQPRMVRRKDASKVFTDPVVDLMPESEQLKRLTELERKIDFYAEKAKHSLAPFQRSEELKEKRTLRLYISHVAVPNPTEDDAHSMKWSLRIEGRLLEKPNATYRRRDSKKKKFAGFIDNIHVEFDKEKLSQRDRLVEVIFSSLGLDLVFMFTVQTTILYCQSASPSLLKTIY